MTTPSKLDYSHKHAELMKALRARVARWTLDPDIVRDVDALLARGLNPDEVCRRLRAAQFNVDAHLTAATRLEADWESVCREGI